MNRPHALGLAFAALCAMQAHASQVIATGFALTAYDSVGTVDPTAVAIAGSDQAGAIITYTPPKPSGSGPGSSGPYGVGQDPVRGPSWNANIDALGNLFQFYGTPPVYFGARVQTSSGSLDLSAFATTFPVQNYAYAGQTGTFSLAPHSSLVLSTSVSITGDAYATFALGLDGGAAQGWGNLAQGDTFVSLTVMNSSDLPETGFFNSKVVASTTPVPEPAETSLLLAGLIAIGAFARRRQAAAVTKGYAPHLGAR